LRLYNINKNTCELESNNINIDAFCKIQQRLKERLRDRIKKRIRDRLRYNIFNLEDYESGVARGDYINTDELFTGENICDIPPKRLYILCNKNNKNTYGEEKRERSGKYVFDAVELEYFVRKCRENKQEPYNPYNRDKLDEDFLENLYIFIKYNGLLIKNDEYLWENNMHAFTELSLEIESRGFYNSPEWFERLKDADFLKVIKYFKLFSANTPESNKYFNEIRADTLIFDFCKDAIKMFKECNNEYYILCCNFIKAMALCSNNFYNNLPAWLLANGTGGMGAAGAVGAGGAGGAGGHMGIGGIIDNIRINTNLETLMGAMNRNNASELAKVHTQNVIEEKQKNTIDTYISKFKTSFYGFLLFIILSLPVAYKILDMIGKIISQNIEIYDFNTEEPSPLGRVIMGLIVLILLFIL